ncbi:MAG: T9SS type A sorting domain-containing protein [Bacteroidota bacterium]
MLRSAFVLAFALLLGVTALPAHAAEADVDDLSLEYVDETAQPFRLSAARPNPFTTTTRLQLSLDATTALRVAVFDALGREVMKLHEGTLQPGTYNLRLDGSNLPPGLYLVRATDGRGTTVTRSVALSR